MPGRLRDLPQRARRGHGIAALQPRDGRLRRVHTLRELRLRKVRAGARLDQRADEGVLFFEIVTGLGVSGIAGIVLRVNIACLDRFDLGHVIFPGVPG